MRAEPLNNLHLINPNGTFRFGLKASLAQMINLYKVIGLL